jgi:hypothetical protein
LDKVSRIGLVLALAAVFLASFVGIAGAAVPPAGGTQIIHASYVVKNDADSGYSNGYWALDNFTQTLTVWKTTTPAPGSESVYQVNVTDVGTWCTFAGSPSPNAGTAQPYGECGVMTGGYDGNLTTGITPVNTPQTTIGDGVILAGGTVASDGVITPGPISGQSSWMDYFFPGVTIGGFNGIIAPSTFAFANSGLGWSWTYTDANRNVWIDSGVVPQASSGEILVSSSNNEGSVQAVASVIPQTCSLSAAGAINFGSVIPGGPRVAASSPVTVTDEGDVGTGVSIYGSDWSSSQQGDLGAGSVGYTVYNVGATYAPNAYLTGSPVSTGVTLAANGGSSSAYSFGLQVPVTVKPATLKQTITFVSSC